MKPLTHKNRLSSVSLRPVSPCIPAMKSIATAVIGTLLGAGHLFAATPAKPNVLYIVADDLGYGDLGVHGCKDIPTPNLDALAGEGVQFVNGYVTGTVCSPTRCALLTGRYQQRDGVGDWVRPGTDVGMTAGVPTIANYLKQAGYRTAIIGKWHLGEKDEFHPMNRGFDDFYGFLGGGRSYYPLDGGQPGDRLMDGRKPVEEEPAYTTFGFGDKAVGLIKGAKASNQPFFIYLSYNAVHNPMHPPKDSNRFDDMPLKGKRRAYAGMLFAMDESIGRVLDTLRKEGLEDNTLIYFISDNGGPTTRNAPNGSQNGPLRGSKGEVWEGGIRVPFFLKWPGHLKAGEKYEPVVSQMDVTATVLALAGVTPEAKYPIDGVNLMPFLTGAKKGDPRSSMSWKSEDQWAIRESKWKLTYAKAKNAKGLTLGLYDLSVDIGEQNDLSAQFPERVKSLQASWEAWQKDVVGDRPPESDSADKKKSP
ncbi:MAG: sulfatase-like hydrolase/transferase [Verrucomicrobiota bacterium]